MKNRTQQRRARSGPPKSHSLRIPKSTPKSQEGIPRGAPATAGHGRVVFTREKLPRQVCSEITNFLFQLLFLCREKSYFPSSDFSWKKFLTLGGKEKKKGIIFSDLYTCCTGNPSPAASFRLHPIRETMGSGFCCLVIWVWGFLIFFFFASEQIHGFLYFLVVKSQRNQLVIRKRDAGCGCRKAGMLQEPRRGIKPRAQSAAVGATSFWILRAKRSPEVRVMQPQHPGDRRARQGWQPWEELGFWSLCILLISEFK